MRVLVIDDAPFMRQMLREVLEGAGHEVHEVGVPGRAQAALAATRPDAVLLDVTMPEIDGLTLLKEFRARDPRVPVLMVSALKQPAIIREAIQLGAADFIMKPFQPSRLLNALAKVHAEAHPLAAG